MKVMDRRETQARQDREAGAGIVDLRGPQLVLELPEGAEALDYHDGVRAAVQMLHAGEIDRRQFFELCYEAATGDDPNWLHLGESA